jgi:hypothetical protein
MNNPDEASVLSRARAGLTPTASDEDRVRRAVAAALAVAPSGLPWRAPRVPLGGRVRSWAARLAVAGAIAAAAGVVGYRAGFRAGREQSARPAAVAPAIPSLVPPVIAVPEPRPPIEPPRTSPAARAPRATPPAVTATSPAESLEAEVRTLRGAERALRDHQPGLALALLRELDRAVPNGKLIEEREATAAIARCALGQVPFGVDLAGDFAQRHPRSVYLQRVEQACQE